jgi:hypothetical protein
MTYTKEIEALSKALQVEVSVAMDIDYLRSLEKRIIKAAHTHAEVRNFSVYNSELEAQLEMFGV